ncbi:unnamed protein product [Rhizophagus irregularis]|uniref:Uncharacterized protein n=1 Tax=Rhizophagus irregularis TaxID=588596 RepID=A0A916E3U8_9GLOM|nr:unnamed protein product [Rhizophagus irregularis]
MVKLVKTKDQLIGLVNYISTFALDRITDTNQLQLFALDHYQLQFLDIFVFSFGLVSWEVLKFGYFFGTLDDIGVKFLIRLLLIGFFLLFFVDIGRLSDRYDF